MTIRFKPPFPSRAARDRAAAARRSTAADMRPRPRVLAVAEGANPEMVSVPLVGWSIATALRDVADVHIVTQVRNREAFLRAGLVEGTDFTAIDSEAVARPLWRLSEALGVGPGSGKGWTAAQAISLVSAAWFERLVWDRFGDAVAAGDWDVVHRITPLSPTKPSSLAVRCARVGTPFVLGPLNGGVPWPAAFDAERRREREWLSYARGAYKLLPGRRATLRAAAAILVGSRHTQSEIPAAFRAKTVWIPENGIDPERFNLEAAPGTGGAPGADEPGGRPLTACFVGRMVPYKGPDMALEAAAPLLADGRMRLEMIGDGPMLDGLRAQAERLGVADAVVFHGWLDHRDVQGVMARCDLMALPSIREFGGGVVLEAMALGLPPVVVDYAGPGELVEPDWGLKLPLGDRAALVASFRDAFARLAADPAPLATMGALARARVETAFTWASKAQQIAAVYDWVRRDGGDPPQPCRTGARARAGELTSAEPAPI